MVEINPFSALSAVGAAAKDRASVADNLDTFLSLLTTQLKNQSPLDPLDTNQFTQQLVQFSEVEQTVKINANLERIAQLGAANTITSAVGFIGKNVTTSGTSTTLTGGKASWSYSVAGDSPSATFTVSDSAGRPVYTETKPVTSGTGTFAWNGQTSTGSTAPDGRYTLSIRADDGSGGVLEASTSVGGIVDGVDMSGDEPVLIIDGRRISLTDVASISAVPGN
ncbi:MAG: flagellar hook assembly protein FlgD [Pseudomonadota bacterium]|nr:flagellar hook assembly protein FlgD [Pseudomonadota bacterium]